MKKKYLFTFLITTLTLGSCQESLNEKCARECRQYTQKNCPAKIDENIILDSMVFEANSRTIHYYYTLTGAADSIGILTQEEVHKALVDQLRNTTTMRVYKEEDFKFAYTYHSQQRPELVLFEETLTEKDYN